MTKGIDISYCQKKIDWTKVNVDFCIIRAGYGRYERQKDNMFESHYAGAKSRGIPVGVYWYSYAKTPEDAVKEADACLAVIKGKQYEFPIFYDVEEEDVLALGKAKVSAIIKAFLERVEAAGYWVGLYMSANPLTNLVTDTIKNRYSVWVANVGVSKPAYSGSYGIWQYSWKGKLDGVTGDVDLDYCYVDYPAKIKERGLNGFEKPPSTPAEPAEPVKQTKEVTLIIDGETWKGTLKKEGN